MLASIVTGRGAILNREPDLIATSHPDVPAGIERVLRRALAKLPENRYPSIAVFAADLMALAPGGESQPPDSGPITERRHAAVLVTIVSNYGSLVERMTPVDAHRLVAQIRDMAVDAVRRHGGMVNQAIGEEIVSVFGVPAAHDDDELRAVRGALELHARVQEIAATSGSIPPIQIQSGLHAGSVVAQRLSEGPRRYAIVGAPANAASRLAALAAPGDVVLSHECQRLLSPFVHTAACAPVVLEPGAPPVTPFRVTGQTGLETRLEASERSGLTPYVGREAELAVLEEYIDGARRGDGRVIEIVGEAGVGKSRLLHELRERVSAAESPGDVDEIAALQGRHVVPSTLPRTLPSFSIHVVPSKRKKPVSQWLWEPATFGFPPKRPPQQQWVRLPDRRVLIPGRPGQACPESSPQETPPIRPIARRSPRQARAAWRPSMRSGSSAPEASTNGSAFSFRRAAW